MDVPAVVQLEEERNLVHSPALVSREGLLLNGVENIDDPLAVAGEYECKSSIDRWRLENSVEAIIILQARRHLSSECGWSI